MYGISSSVKSIILPPSTLKGRQMVYVISYEDMQMVSGLVIVSLSDIIQESLVIRDTLRPVNIYASLWIRKKRRKNNGLKRTS